MNKKAKAAIAGVAVVAVAGVLADWFFLSDSGTGAGSSGNTWHP